MHPQRLDITLAFKAIALSDVLSGTEKQVAAAIVDSFNFHTAQCDPSFDRIAHLIGKSRRTVIRAVVRLVKIGLLIRARHGGGAHRNSYKPNWPFFRSLETRWKARCKTRHWGVNVSHSPVPNTGHLPGDEPGTQTIPINQSLETSPPTPLQPQPVEADRVADKRTSLGAMQAQQLPRRPSNGSARSVITDAAAAAHTAAERRWNDALLIHYRDRSDLYEQAVVAIDPALAAEATGAELARKGTGLRYILNQFIARGLRL